MSVSAAYNNIEKNFPIYIRPMSILVLTHPLKFGPPQRRRLSLVNERSFARQPWKWQLNDQRFRTQEWIWARQGTIYLLLPASTFLLLRDDTNHWQGSQWSSRLSLSSYRIGLCAHLRSRTIAINVESALLLICLVQTQPRPNALWRTWDVLQFCPRKDLSKNLEVAWSSDCPGCLEDIKCLLLCPFCDCVASLVSFNFFIIFLCTYFFFIQA